MVVSLPMVLFACTKDKSTKVDVTRFVYMGV